MKFYALDIAYSYKICMNIHSYKYAQNGSNTRYYQSQTCQIFFALDFLNFQNIVRQSFLFPIGRAGAFIVDFMASTMRSVGISLSSFGAKKSAFKTSMAWAVFKG